METMFAPSERVSSSQLEIEVDIVNRSPVISALLHSISGLLVVIDENRQIVALNSSFLKMLGIHDPEEALGLRLGEAVRCIHSGDKPAGCGTTKYCSSCGGAVAIVSSLEQDNPVEMTCSLTARRGERTKDIALLVKSHPIIISAERFLLIFLQDITKQQQRAALERTFFHDVGNLLFMLLGSCELLVKECPSDLAKSIHKASIRLHKEIAIQRCLSNREVTSYLPERNDVTTETVLLELKSFFSYHPVADARETEFTNSVPNRVFNTDTSLLLRILTNMTTNALEATEEGGLVRVWIEENDDQLVFSVWNKGEISPQIARRIFQRNFSTKNQAGRGVGTFSMKLFGEEILGGLVSFTTSATDGTVFSFSHPV